MFFNFIVVVRDETCGGLKMIIQFNIFSIGNFYGLMFIHGNTNEVMEGLWCLLGVPGLKQRTKEGSNSSCSSEHSWTS